MCQQVFLVAIPVNVCVFQNSRTDSLFLYTPTSFSLDPQINTWSRKTAEAS